MTNDKTVTLSRELAERILRDSQHGFMAFNDGKELRALLAAPVVERQEPVAWHSWSVGDTVRYLGSGEDNEDCYCRMMIGSDYLIHEAPDEFEMMLVLDDDGDELGVLVGEFEFIARDGYSRTSPPAPVAVAQHPFADKVISKLQRFVECADDGQGADIGRHWFNILTQLGLLNRVQRSLACGK